MFICAILFLIATSNRVLAQECLLKSTYMVIPITTANQPASTECTMKPSCGTTLENNVVSLSTSLLDQQFKNEWTNYSETMLTKCSWSCRSMTNCVGFNYRASKTAYSDDVYCHLFPSQPMLFLSTDDCIYYEVCV